MTTTATRKMPLREAAEKWVETTRAIEGLVRLQKEYAAILLAPVEKAGKERVFFGLVRAEATGGNLYLDQAAVREELGPERFVEGDLMKRQKRGWTLKAMK